MTKGKVKYTKEESKLANSLAVMYVLNESYCSEETDKYLKITEIMTGVSNHLKSLDIRNDYDDPEKQKHYARQFRRYIVAIQNIAHVEMKTGKNGGYRIAKPINEFALLDQEEIDMLSLTLSNSDLVSCLIKKPNIGSRLNTGMVKNGTVIDEDVFYGLVDASDAIKKHCKICLTDYKKQNGTVIKEPFNVTPVAIRLFKGTYYEVCLTDNQPTIFKDYRFERAGYREVLDNKPGLAYKQKDADKYVDQEAFGLHRDGQRERITIQVENKYLQRLKAGLDTKEKRTWQEGNYSYIEVIAYGINEIVSYNRTLFIEKRAKITSEIKCDYES